MLVIKIEALEKIRMKLSQLRKLLDQKISSSDFLDQIRGETSDAKKQMGKQGSSVPIYVDEDIFFVLSIKDLKLLLDLFAMGSISDAEMDYIGSCIELSENIGYQSELMADIVFGFSTQDINGPFTISRAKELISQLKSI